MAYEAPASGATLDMRQIVRVERRMVIRDPTVPECSAPESNQGVHEGNTAAGQAMTTTQTERPEFGADPVNGYEPRTSQTRGHRGGMSRLQSLFSL